MRVLDLFAGAGGSALGSTLATELFVADVDRYCLNTLEINRSSFFRRNPSLKSFSVISRDLIQNPIGSEIGDIDLLLAGPPCQPFSRSGKLNGFLDFRNGLDSVAYSIKRIQPRGFVVENVPGITAERFRGDLHLWACQLAKAVAPPSLNFASSRFSLVGDDYAVFSTILNSADYGVAQVRPRWFCVGIRKDLFRKEWSWPTRRFSDIALLRCQFETFSYWNDFSLPTPHSTNKRSFPDDDCKRWRTCRDVFHVLGTPSRAVPRGNSAFGHFSRANARSYRGHSGSFIDSPSKAIKAGSHGVPGGENMVRHRNGKVRYFTLKECSTIQGFPLEYIFDGSFTRVMKLIGNACPPQFLEVILENLGPAIS